MLTSFYAIDWYVDVRSTFLSPFRFSLRSIDLRGSGDADAFFGLGFVNAEIGVICTFRLFSANSRSLALSL